MKRKGRERVAEVIDPAQRLDPCRFLGRLPVTVAEVVQVEVPAIRCREHELPPSLDR